MNLRSLVNLAYAALAENRDKDELAVLDGILEGADRAGQNARTMVTTGPVQRRGENTVPPATPGERLLRAVPNNPMGLAAAMAGVAVRTRR